MLYRAHAATLPRMSSRPILTPHGGRTAARGRHRRRRRPARPRATQHQPLPNPPCTCMAVADRILLGSTFLLTAAAACAGHAKALWPVAVAASLAFFCLTPFASDLLTRALGDHD